MPSEFQIAWIKVSELTLQVVQSALEFVDAEDRLKIIAELDGQYLECVKQANANHVIQVSAQVYDL